MDLLVLTSDGLVLVEIKSRPGSVRGDAHTWIWMTDGRPVMMDNPPPLANRKAKRLASVLRRQEALTGRGAPRGTAPWIECKRRSENPSLRQPGCPVAPE